MSTSAIDAKQQDDNDGGKTNNWGAFGVEMLKNVVIVVFMTLLGCNWLFMCHYDALDIIFPTELSEYLKNSGGNSVSRGGGRRKNAKNMRGGGSDYTCKPSVCNRSGSFSGPSLDFLEKLGYGKSMSESWPYELYNGNEEEPFGWDGFLNWFAKSEANAFIYYRRFMKSMYQWPMFKLMPEPLVFLIVPIFAFCLKLVVCVCGILTTLVSWFMAGPKSIWYFLISIFIPFFLPLVMLGNTGVQLFSAFYYVFLAPMLIDFSTIAKIARCNIKWISFFFALLTVVSASNHLDSTTSTTMMVAWIIMAIKACFF
tara:strand:- start:1 stop:936 length:936 start_codon:yes stop_codon:yes gene_type:complete